MLYGNKFIWFPFQSTVAVASAVAVVQEFPNVQTTEYRPEVPGISDRRTGECHLY